jgi:hypothetical protein
MGLAMTKKWIRPNVIGSLLDEPAESARRMLQACLPETKSFWIDHTFAIHAAPPKNVPPGAECLIVGTYSLGARSADIEADLRTERSERARSWSVD